MEPLMAHERLTMVRQFCMSPAEVDAMKATAARDILAAYHLKPWHTGTAPVPRRVRLWRKVTLARWRARWMLRRGARR